MSLLKRTVTPARLEANRRNALKSTGPRTAEGKSRSSLNAMKRGGRSQTQKLLWQILQQAPVGGVRRMARQVLTPGQLSKPGVQFMLSLFWSRVDLDLEPEGRFLRKYLRLKPSKSDDRSLRAL